MRVQLETFVGNIAIPVAVLYWLLLSGLICFFNSDGTSAARAKRMSVGSSRIRVSNYARAPLIRRRRLATSRWVASHGHCFVLVSAKRTDAV